MDCKMQSAALPRGCHHPAVAAAARLSDATADKFSMASHAYVPQVAATANQLVVQQVGQSRSSAAQRTTAYHTSQLPWQPKALGVRLLARAAV